MPESHPTSMHRPLVSLSETTAHIADGALRLEFTNTVIRACLIHAAFSASEYIYADGDPSRYPKLYDSIRRLLIPSDGDLLVALDNLIPIVHDVGWRGCSIGWFEGELPARTQLRKWVEFRNNRLGHGVVAQNIVDEALPWLSTLSTHTIAALHDLLPLAASGDALHLIHPRGVLQMELLRLHQGTPTLIRKVQPRGATWRAQAQTICHTTSTEFSYTLSEESAIVQLALGTTSLYEARSTNRDGTPWKPMVLLPRRSTSTFCGREREYDELRDWFNDTSSRACLVFGEGGIGKTTLVLEFINDVLDGLAVGVSWRPEIICFYSAKQTRWSAGGLEKIRGVFPAISEAVRDLVRVYENHPGRDWYSDDPRSLISKAEDLLRNLGVSRDNVLLVLDNTETLAARRDDEVGVSGLMAALRRVGRLLLTSRRHEKVEAHPLEVPPMTDDEGALLLSRLGEALNAEPLLQAGNATRKRLSRSLRGRPILLEVLARYASHGGRSLKSALELVQKDAERDLGDFLFQDAWERMEIEQRDVFFLIQRLGASADDTLLGWVCAEVGIASTVWLDAFEETRFGALRDYGTRFDIILDPAAESFLLSRFNAEVQAKQQDLEKLADKLERRYRRLLMADDWSADDRVAQAFSSAPAKLAKLAAARGDFDDAQAWYEEAVRVDGSNAALWDRYAWFLCMRTRDLARAKACAAEAVRLAPRDADAQFTAGLVAARLGDVPAADSYLMRAAELGKRSHLCAAQRARARVVAFENNEDESLAVLNVAQKLLDEAELSNPRTNLDFKHRRECLTTRKRISKLFSDFRNRPGA